MPGFSIPKHDHEGLRKLSTLTEEQFEAIKRGLEEVPPKFYMTDVERSVRDRVKTVAEADLHAILTAVWTAASTKSTFDLPIESFGTIVSTTAAEEGIVADATQGQRLGRRLSELVDLPNLNLPLKARSVLSEGRVFCRGRIVSDIRPIFGTEDEVVKPSAAVIVHTLTMHYHQDGELRSTAVQLDQGDLEEIAHMVERAQEKHKQLLEILKNSNVSHMDVE